ncbi:MAG: HAMP domain-containing protein [Proteobacteria bacterium]|nr:HAMP domain-containing protein [Pseudomonadota bacterium]
MINNLNVINNLKIFYKIGIGLTIPVILIVVINLYQLNLNKTIIENLELTKNESISTAMIALQMDKDIVQIRQRLTEISATRAAEGFDEGFDEAEKSYLSFLKGLEHFSTIYERGNDRESQNRIEQLKKDVVTYYDAGKLMAEAYIEEGPESGNESMGDFDQQAEQLSTNLQPFLKNKVNAVNEALISVINDAGNQSTYLTFLAFLILLGACVFSLIIIRSLSTPIHEVVNFVESMSEGDFSGQMDMKRKDEVGALVVALNKTSVNVSRMIVEIGKKINSFAQATTDLDDLSNIMSQNADDSVTMANTVASAAEEVTANMHSIAAAMEESSTNINSVAASTEEMSVNIKDIAQRSVAATETTQQAVEQAANSVNMISDLGKASQEIGTVTETIASISDKTNLLALNATIEAARAGEAGKGFAVVAGEIKSLAQQTAEATTDIAIKLKAIQQSTSSSVADITEIEKRIREVNEIVSSINDSMEQQENATIEISTNVSQTSHGLGEVNDNASQTSEATGQIAMEIAEVNEAANGISNSSAMVNQTVGNLAKMANGVSQLLDQFTVLNSKFRAGPIKAAHSVWRKRLSDLIANKINLDPSEVSNHHNCDFGKWYFSEGQMQFKDLPLFLKIDEEHKKVHETAKQITQLHKDGETKRAKQLLIEFKEITETLFDSLDNLESDAAKMH